MNNPLPSCLSFFDEEVVVVVLRLVMVTALLVLVLTSLLPHVPHGVLGHVMPSSTIASPTTTASHPQMRASLTSSLASSATANHVAETEKEETPVTFFTWGKDLNGTEFGLGMDVDAQGNIYVVGGSTTLGNGSWYQDSAGIILKFSPSGAVQWNVTWGTDPVGESLLHVAVDDARDVLYAAGRYGAGISGPAGVEPMNAVLLKVDARTGAILWEWQWKDSYSLPLDVAVDDEGNAYLLVNAAWDEGDVTGDGRVDVRDAIIGLVLFKFLPDGTMAWNSTYGVPRGDYWAWLKGASDPMGFDPVNKEVIALAGLSYTDGIADDADTLLVKWDASGNLSWVTHWLPEFEDGWVDVDNDLAFDVKRGLIYTLGRHSKLEGKFYPAIRTWNATTGDLVRTFNYTYEDWHTTALVASALAVDPRSGMLHAVVDDTNVDTPCGTLHAFRINPHTGAMELLDTLNPLLILKSYRPADDWWSCADFLYDWLWVTEEDGGSTFYTVGDVVGAPVNQTYGTGVDVIVEVIVVKWELPPLPSTSQNFSSSVTTAVASTKVAMVVDGGVVGLVTVTGILLVVTRVASTSRRQRRQ